MSEANQSLPAFYDENMIGFFPRCPNTVFAYWELSLELWEAVAEMGGAFIRLYRVFENGNSEHEYHLIREIEPPPFTDNWYFEGLGPGAMYCFEVGGKLGDGSFLPLLKSQTASTPPLPGFDVLTGQGPAAVESLYAREVLRGTDPEEGGNSMGLAEVLVSMPFYMGYRKPGD